jgi:3-hydroxyisobutyrate dehydrogenase
MGEPMAANLAREGFAVRSFDLKGNGNCKSVRDAVRNAEAVITMLPDGAAVREAVLEALPAISPGAIVVDMSSSDPFGTRALGAALSARKIAFVKPGLEAMGKSIFHVGSLGAGHAVKALNNYLGAAGTLAGFEALIIARAFGLDPEPMLKAINASTGRNSTTEKKIARDVLTGAWASGFKLALMTKDVGIAAALADDLGLRTPFLKETLRAWREARKSLAKDADHSEIYKYQEKLARKRARSAPPRAGRKPARRSRG